MRTAKSGWLVVAFLWLISGSALAEDAASPKAVAESIDQMLPTTPLLELIGRVAKKSGKQFLVAGPVPAHVVVGPVGDRELDYSVFLTILQNNGLGAVPAGDYTNIIPLAWMRQNALPLVSGADACTDELQWISRIVQLKHASAAHLVPIVRPLLMQYGHLAAIAPSNSMLIVERCNNVQAVTNILRELDKLEARPQA